MDDGRAEIITPFSHDPHQQRLRHAPMLRHQLEPVDNVSTLFADGRQRLRSSELIGPVFKKGVATELSSQIATPPIAALNRAERCGELVHPESSSGIDRPYRFCECCCSGGRVEVGFRYRRVKIVIAPGDVADVRHTGIITWLAESQADHARRLIA